MGDKSMRRFTKRVALVTGGASGIGLAAAQEFAHEGVAAVILDLDEAQGRGAQNIITAAGGHALLVPTDVASRKARTRAVTGRPEPLRRDSLPRQLGCQLRG